MPNWANILHVFTDTKEILLAANRQVYAIDRHYVIYRWISKMISSVRTLGLFVIGAALIGHAIQTPQMSWTIVLSGIVAYAIYQATKMVIGSYANERREVFDALLRTHMELRRVRHLATLDIGRLVDPVFVELSRMVERRGVSSIRGLWDSQIDLVGAIVSLLMTSVILLSLDPVLGLLAVSIAIPSIVHRWRKEQRQREIDEAEIIVLRQRDEVYNAITHPETAVLMRLLRFTKRFMTRYETFTETLVSNVRQMVRFETRGNLIVGLISLTCLVILGLYFSSGLVEGRYSYVQIGAIVGSLRLVAGALREFGWSIGRIVQKRRDYHYLARFLKTGPLVDESACKPISLSKTPELVFEEAVFAYPNQTKRAVDGVSFTIAPGEKIALVGPNGCGKTTLLRLLARVYVPTTGKIWADQHPLDAVLQESWLDHAVMITQAAMLPGMEIARALTGDELDKADKDRLGEALVLSGAAPIVTQLPHGLNTWIGEQWPNGRGFSTGERQRLALAAVFYRLLDSKVFIAMFDEPTANCDAATKARFYGAISKAQEFAEKTVLVSLHDPLYLKYFDRVLLFDSGKLVKDLRGDDEIAAYQSNIALALAQDL